MILTNINTLHFCSLPNNHSSFFLLSNVFTSIAYSFHTKASNFPNLSAKGKQQEQSIFCGLPLIFWWSFPWCTTPLLQG